MIRKVFTMIKYFDRQTRKYEIEKIAGERYLSWTTSSPIGMKFLELIIKKKFFSSVYGWACNRGFSRRKIKQFVTDYDIDMNLTKQDINEFTSFNEFFSRKLKAEARPVDMNKATLVSPGDGRLLAYENIDMDNIVQIKGYSYRLRDLIADPEVAKKYSFGTCLVLRLCPTDYHRFHFIDSGICDNTTRIKGDYYSVNPLSLAKVPETFCRNKREWSIFHSHNFGDVLYVEVGATCVGTIIQTYEPYKPVNKGDEKGYFRFGGSTVVLFFARDTIKIDEDITHETSLGIETKILMGEHIGTKF
jgi:phosphatidylserine decarboxylase